MLFKELQNLTDDRCTHEEYEAINKIYMDCRGMTQEDAAKVWKMTYGRCVPKKELDMDACMEIAVLLAWLKAGDDLERLSRYLTKALHSLGVTVTPMCRRRTDSKTVS